MSSSLALRKNASVQNRCKGEKVNVPYASEKGPLFGKERALNEIKTTAAESRGDIRKRRRKRSAFAGLQRQSPLTTTKGAGAVQAAKNPVGSSTGQGDLRSRAGARLTRPQPTAGLFLALPSKSGLFRCRAVLPQDFGCRKCEKGRRKPWWLARPFEHFVRQNPKAEPSFSCATPAKLRCLLLEHRNTIEAKAFRRLSSSGCDALAFCGKQCSSMLY